MSAAIESGAAVRIADSILDEIEAVYDEITRRAYELFQGRRQGQAALDVEDWLSAERELLYKPEIEFVQQCGRVRITADLAGASLPRSVEVVIAGRTLLIHSLKSCSYPKIFRTLNLPASINALTAEAHVENGALILTAAAL